MLSEDSDLLTVGWEEWCSLDKLGLPCIKAKVDTGAKTSSLHAFDIVCVRKGGVRYVDFKIHPLQHNSGLVVFCRAPVVDRRYVSDSGGHREQRFVIITPLTLGSHTWPIELTLANRDTMAFRMLLGREALRGKAVVNPLRSYCQGRITLSHAISCYRSKSSAE